MSQAVAIGVFDGLHLGHADILHAALERARAGGGRCVVVSFDPHPDVVLATSFATVAPLTPLAEKRERMATLGVDEFDVLPFTRELSALSPESFVERFLVERHHPTALVVGENFALGHRRAGDVPYLRRLGPTYGFEVEAVPLRRLDDAPISSTRIREALSRGQVREAERMLGRRYTLAGTVVRGEAIGRTLGFPTANLRLHEEKFLPGFGIYAGWARIARSADLHAAAISIGVRPTYGGQVPTIEAFLLDWSGELVGRELELELVDWLRAELRFDGPAALRAAIARDVEETRRRLAAPA
jgi:riboflavin kinase/FMN adenylyltransferase